MSIQGNWDRRTFSRRHLLGWPGMGAGALAAAGSGLSAQVSCRPADSTDGYCEAALDPDRTILGDEQERWPTSG